MTASISLVYRVTRTKWIRIELFTRKHLSLFLQTKRMSDTEGQKENIDGD